MSQDFPCLSPPCDAAIFLSSELTLTPESGKGLTRASQLSNPLTAMLSCNPGGSSELSSLLYLTPMPQTLRDHLPFLCGPATTYVFVVPL